MTNFGNLRAAIQNGDGVLFYEALEALDPELWQDIYLPYLTGFGSSLPLREVRYEDEGQELSHQFPGLLLGFWVHNSYEIWFRDGKEVVVDAPLNVVPQGSGLDKFYWLWLQRVGQV